LRIINAQLELLLNPLVSLQTFYLLRRFTGGWNYQSASASPSLLPGPNHQFLTLAFVVLCSDGAQSHGLPAAAIEGEEERHAHCQQCTGWKT
jgi:hypothetical protein